MEIVTAITSLFMKIYDKLYLLKTGIPNYILKDIADWTVDEAVSIASQIDGVYAFRFQRRGWEESRSSGVYNVKAIMIKESGTYYLEGYTETISDIKARISLNNEKKTDSDRLLVKRLEEGGYTTIIRSVQSGVWSCVFHDGIDMIIEKK
jgi:hypothetical protein